LSDFAESLRIREEAQAICEPYRIGVTNVDPLPGVAGGGFAVTIWLPRDLALDGREVTEVRSRLESIPGVSKVWVLLSPSAA
jgi:hypothetical protein